MKWQPVREFDHTRMWPTLRRNRRRCSRHQHTDIRVSQDRLEDSRNTLQGVEADSLKDHDYHNGHTYVNHTTEMASV